MTFDILTGIAVGFSLICLIFLSTGILSLGKLITETPDLEELKGKVKTDEMRKIPEKMSRIFIIAFTIIFIIGSGIILLSDSKILLIVGIVTIFSSLLFAGTIAFYEFMIYGQMKKNIKKFEENNIRSARNGSV